MQKLVRNGVGLVYEEAGRGEPAILLVHGWTCNRAFSAPQLEHFCVRHRTIAVDLRGHGDSDKPVQEYTIEGFADDLVWLCDRIGVEAPVVIGHSMGGLVTLELAARHPGATTAIVMIDSPVVPPPARIQGLSALIELLETQDLDTRRRALVDRYFLDTDDRERMTWIVDQMLAAPQHVRISAARNFNAYDSAAAAAACKVPTLFINAATPRPELDRLRELCPQAVIGQTVGAGHFTQMEVPDQVNAMIDRFLTISLPGPSAGR